MPKNAEVQQSARKKIFCVNGSVEFLDLLRELFQSEQYNVTTSNYVPENFEMVDALQPDLIVIDLVIGHRMGFDLLERLSREAATRDIPVIITSTQERAFEEVEAHPERYGGTVQILKPLDIEALLEAVNRLIGPAQA